MFIFNKLYCYCEDKLMLCVFKLLGILYCLHQSLRMINFHVIVLKVIGVDRSVTLKV